MTFKPSVIINLAAYRPSRPERPANRFALQVLHEAERLVDMASDDVQAGICNASAGIATDRLGGLSDGRTLSIAVRAALELMNLRHCPADAPLRAAIEEWLHERGNGNG
jgi:hypothetical protein